MIVAIADFFFSAIAAITAILAIVAIKWGTTLYSQLTGTIVLKTRDCYESATLLTVYSF